MYILRSNHAMLVADIISIYLVVSVNFIGNPSRPDHFIALKRLLSNINVEYVYIFSISLSFLFDGLIIESLKMDGARIQAARSLSLILAVTTIADSARISVFRMRRTRWKVFRDYIGNVSVFSGSYLIWLSSVEKIHLLLLPIFLVGLGLIFYYRIYAVDDVSLRELDKSSKFYRLQGLYDNGLRSLLQACLAFSLIDLFLFFSAGSRTAYFSINNDAIELNDWGPLFKMFYFNIVSATTVGYGDIFPSQDASRVFMIVAHIYFSLLLITIIQLGVARISEPIQIDHANDPKLLPRDKRQETEKETRDSVNTL